MSIIRTSNSRILPRISFFLLPLNAYHKNNGEFFYLGVVIPDCVPPEVDACLLLVAVARHPMAKVNNNAATCLP
jgi:hypothetical protein